MCTDSLWSADEEKVYTLFPYPPPAFLILFLSLPAAGKFFEILEAPLDQEDL